MGAYISLLLNVTHHMVMYIEIMNYFSNDKQEKIDAHTRVYAQVFE